MILFCDTSALVKLYVQEEGTDTVTGQAIASDAIAVCRIAWVEIMSALARRAREQPRDAAAIAQARERFAADWPQYLTLEINQELVELAGEYADAFALRAYDSVQLAAAQTLNRELPGKVSFAQIQHAIWLQVQKVQQQEKNDQHHDNDQDGRATAGTLAIESSHKASNTSVIRTPSAVPEKVQWALAALLGQP